MINTSRRTTLKLFSATLATAGTVSLAPLKALAGLVQAPQSPTPDSAVDLPAHQHEATDVVFSVDRLSELHGGHSVVTILNRSQTAVTLRYIQPGFVHAEGRTYDLNQLLQDGPLTLAAGDAVRLPLSPIVSAISTDADSGWHVPRGLVSQPVVVKTRLARSSGLNDVRTDITTEVTMLRSLFS